MKYSVKKLVTMALLTALSLILFTVEQAFPPIVPIPAVKIGLANIVTLWILFMGENWKFIDAALVLLTRILLSALITGQPMTLIFSAVGGALAFASMAFGKKMLKGKLIPVVSVFGGAMHNIGQIAAAMLVYQSVSTALYLPALLISGIIGGLFNGFAVMFLLRLQPKFIHRI